MYSSDLIEEVVSRNDIVDVISGYIKLKKKPLPLGDGISL